MDNNDVNNNKLIVTVIIGGFFFWAVANAQESDFYVANLDSNCLKCLCHAATDCDLARGYVQGYAGPFKISNLYWIDAGNITLPNDDPERGKEAFIDCAYHYECAAKVVKGYIAKFAKDCNGDGVTNCDDYSMINFNGGWKCDPDLNRNEAGRNWTRRYNQCRPT